MTESTVVRPARAEDLPEVGEMAAELVRFHHALDPLRFLLVDGVAQGYTKWFGSQLTVKETVILVAERGEKKVGYAYARLEPRDWNALLDAHGALHDIYVIPEARRTGAASALLAEVVKRLSALGAPRIVLSSATENHGAHRLFERHGFRYTMVEMTRERGSDDQ